MAKGPGHSPKAGSGAPKAPKAKRSTATTPKAKARGNANAAVSAPKKPKKVGRPNWSDALQHRRALIKQLEDEAARVVQHLFTRLRAPLANLAADGRWFVILKMFNHLIKGKSLASMTGVAEGARIIRDFCSEAGFARIKEYEGGERVAFNDEWPVGRVRFEPLTAWGVLVEDGFPEIPGLAFDTVFKMSMNSEHVSIEVKIEVLRYLDNGQLEALVEPLTSILQATHTELAMKTF